jgi:DNA-binding response OmpR family regulator
MNSSKAMAVLVVDDDPDTADSLVMILQFRGFRARAADSEEASRRCLRDGFAPDAVVMDVGLPGKDGFRLGRELCECLPRRPLLVAVTGHAKLEERSKESGFDFYFVKPADPEDLVSVLSAHAVRLHHASGRGNPGGRVDLAHVDSGTC